MEPEKYDFCDDSQNYWPGRSHLPACEARRVTSWSAETRGSTGSSLGLLAEGGLLSVSRREFCWLCSRGGHQRTGRRRHRPQNLGLAAPHTKWGTHPAGPWGKAPIRSLSSTTNSRHWIIHALQLYSISYLIHGRVWAWKQFFEVGEMLAVGSGGALRSWPSRGLLWLLVLIVLQSRGTAVFFSLSLSENRQIIQSDSRLACDIWLVPHSDSALHRCARCVEGINPRKQTKSGLRRYWSCFFYCVLKATYQSKA